jgi:hypothetical protein
MLKANIVFSQGVDNLNRRLLISLCLITAINTLGWFTPIATSMILVGLNVDTVNYINIFVLVASTCIELGSCAMCPTLYAIK